MSLLEWERSTHRYVHANGIYSTQLSFIVALKVETVAKKLQVLILVGGFGHRVLCKLNYITVYY